MTVTSTQARYRYSGDGAAAVFAFPAMFIGAGDLVVDLRDPAGSQQAGALNSGATYGYHIVGTADPATGEYLAGASVSFNTAPPAGWTVTFFDDPAEKQTLELPATGPLPPKGIETALDRLTLEVQALRDRLNRALVAPVQDPLSLAMGLPAQAARATAVAGWDANGQPAVGPAGSFSALLALLGGGSISPPPPPSPGLPATTIAGGGNYTPATGNYTGGGYIWVNRSIPAAVSLAMPVPTTSMVIVVADIAGDAGAAPITLTDSHLFSGAASLLINRPYGAVFLVWNGQSWSQLA